MNTTGVTFGNLLSILGGTGFLGWVGKRLYTYFTSKPVLEFEVGDVRTQHKGNGRYHCKKTIKVFNNSKHPAYRLKVELDKEFHKDENGCNLQIVSPMNLEPHKATEIVVSVMTNTNPLVCNYPFPQVLSFVLSYQNEHNKKFRVKFKEVMNGKLSRKAS
jgi:hypothetical protein